MSYHRDRNHHGDAGAAGACPNRAGVDMARRRAKRATNGHRTAAEEAERDQRRAKCVDLRIKGHTFQSIADALGYANRDAAWRDWRRALELARAEADMDLSDARAFELARLDAVDRLAWVQAEAGELKALEVLLKVSDRRAKMLGLDQPITHTINFEDIDRAIAEYEQRLREAGIDPDTITDDDGADDDDGP